MRKGKRGRKPIPSRPRWSLKTSALPLDSSRLRAAPVWSCCWVFLSPVLHDIHTPPASPPRRLSLPGIICCVSVIIYYPAACRPDWIMAAADFLFLMTRNPITAQHSSATHAVPCCHSGASHPPGPRGYSHGWGNFSLGKATFPLTFFSNWLSGSVRSPP